MKPLPIFETHIHAFNSRTHPVYRSRNSNHSYKITIDTMTSYLYDNETPDDVKNATVNKTLLQCSFVNELTKNLSQGLHLVTENTPNGQKVQIFLEELADAYGTKWTTTLMLVQYLHLATRVLLLTQLF